MAHIAQSASPDGGVVLVDRVADGKTTLMVLSLKDRTLAPFGDVESPQPTGAVFSPDGRWVAYSSRESASMSNAVFIQPFPATGAKSQVSATAEDGHHPSWSSDGKELFFNPGPGRPMTGIAVTTTRGFAFGAAPPVARAFLGLSPLAQRPYDTARDGKRFLGLLSGTAVNAAAAKRIHVVLNWFEERRARATPRP